jgi:hypothetical protein
MTTKYLDDPIQVLGDPLISHVAFYPRSHEKDSSTVPGAIDGELDLEEGESLGYRLFPLQTEGGEVNTTAPLIVMFHGNGELAADYDQLVGRMFHRIGLSVIIWDYRGFGWAKGNPSLLKLGGDTERAVEALPSILTEAGLAPRSSVLLGRSIGSICALHAASVGSFSGLMLENGIHDLMSIPMANAFSSMMPGASRLLEHVKDPFNHIPKLEGLNIPFLVLHSMRDQITPLAQGKALYASATSTPFRHLQVFPDVGHNDLLKHFPELQAMYAAFVAFVTPSSESEEEEGKGEEEEGSGDAQTRQASFEAKVARVNRSLGLASSDGEAGRDLEGLLDRCDRAIRDGDFYEVIRHATIGLRNFDELTASLEEEEQDRLRLRLLLIRARAFFHSDRSQQCLEDTDIVLEDRFVDYEGEEEFDRMFTNALFLQYKTQLKKRNAGKAADLAAALQERLVDVHEHSPEEAERLISEATLQVST